MSQERQSQMSERDDDFFFDSIPFDLLNSESLYEMYSESNGAMIQENFRDSILVAKQIISVLLKRTDDDVYERYLEKSTGPYAINFSLLIAERCFEMGVLINDEEREGEIQIEDLDDKEPERAVHESWFRNKITTEHPNEIKRLTEEEDIKLTQEKTSVSDKVSITQMRLKQKKKEQDQATASEKSEIPKPKSMEVAQEQDEFIERLRVIKQLESKRKEQKEEQEKQDKKLNPQELKKEIKNSKFAYDFDGKILNMKGVKVEKLPPSNYAVSFNFTTQEVERKQKVKKQEELPKNQKGNSQIQQGRDDISGAQANTNKFQTNKVPFSYEDFVPSNGVTLFFESKIKEGPKNGEYFENLANLDTRLRLNGQPLQITRTEYKRLTENGNLNMANSIKTMQDTMLKNKNLKQNNNINNNPSQPGSKKNISLNTSSGNIPLVLQSPNQDQSSFGKSGANMNTNKHVSVLNKKQENNNQLQDSQKFSKIVISQQRLVNQILLSGNDDQSLLTSKDGGKTKLPQIAEKYSNTPVDEFNQRILKGSPDWGKGKAANNSSYSGLPFYKPNKKVLGATLQQFYKMPRERDWGQQLKVSKSLACLANIVSHHEENKSKESADALRGSFYTFNSKFSETLRSFKN